MVGVIKTWDILAHPVVTIRCFGWGVFFRAVVPWRGGTYLSLLQDAGCFSAAPSVVPTILERCINLEMQAKQVYRTLARVFGDQRLAGPFFAGLVEQEQYHADLLQLARAAAIRSGWKANLFNPWKDYLPRLKQQMDAAEATVSGIASVDAALRLVIQIESSEINRVFDAALVATDAAFVKKLKPFQEAMEAHMSYLAEQIPQMAPQLLAAASELRARFPIVRR